MSRAGSVLLLVGAVLSALGVPFALLMLGVFGGFAAPIVGLLGLLLALGAVAGFVAFAKSRAGDAQGAFVWGLVASLLPPLQVLLLVGAILCRISPEAEAARPAAASTSTAHR